MIREEEFLENFLFRINKPFEISEKNGDFFVQEIEKNKQNKSLGVSSYAYCPPLSVEKLGDSSFCSDYGLKYPYLGGSMAHGISSPEISEKLAEGGMLGFVGAGGQSLSWIEDAIARLQNSIPDLPFGFNLIHSPNDPDLEDAIAKLYIKKGINLIEASAFMSITLPLVKYRVHGISLAHDGRIITPNRIIAKISRIEVATKFFSPPPERLLQELIKTGEITPKQAELALKIPMAQDVTAEADSGGHTDNRPAICLFPTILALKDRLQKQFNYPFALRVGLGGGISTPTSLAAAFSMGATYVMTGSVNQACQESGTSPLVREMLAATEQADVCMAPAGDMFEMGVNVQVIKRGTMFPMRAAKLYDLYKTNSSIEEIPENEKSNLEKTVFKDSLEKIWCTTREFFRKRDPREIEKAERDPKHKMALVFRWYLGQSPRWAIEGNLTRRIDFQIWCGPAMGAFNEWTRGSFMEKPNGRKVNEVAMNLLFGAAVLLRVQNLKFQGITLPQEMCNFRPLNIDEIKKHCG
ncbi:MAG: PfaD family polyunsaturated fatty acid/polyketide biosynthesis protein [Candidatus Riflebacteria bacterium]|nr:PfaD family polyunsaturated fatty acid/polyketide biosynthesis protein [Candidatus Riflebacteria bacterium]